LLVPGPNKRGEKPRLRGNAATHGAITPLQLRIELEVPLDNEVAELESTIVKQCSGLRVSLGHSN